MSIVLTKQRRGSLNNTINREISRRERIEIERLEKEQGTTVILLSVNPVYLEWGVERYITCFPGYLDSWNV
jgi:hypothetical protein